MVDVLGRNPGETDESFAARLEREADRCLAHSSREWPHHAAQSRECAQELRAQAQRVRGAE